MDNSTYSDVVNRFPLTDDTALTKKQQKQQQQQSYLFQCLTILLVDHYQQTNQIKFIRKITNDYLLSLHNRLSSNGHQRWTLNNV
jgi:hypothetical protein